MDRESAIPAPQIVRERPLTSLRDDLVKFEGATWERKGHVGSCRKRLHPGGNVHNIIQCNVRNKIHKKSQNLFYKY